MLIFEFPVVTLGIVTLRTLSLKLHQIVDPFEVSSDGPTVLSLVSPL